MRDQQTVVITRALVESVKSGMSEPQVIERLGPPEGYERLYAKHRSLRYGTNGPSPQLGTVLWIHFDEDGRVAEVYSKLYKDWSLENDDEREACSLRSEGNRPSKVFESAFPE